MRIFPEVTAGRIPVGPVIRAVKQLLLFGREQALSCLFPAVIFTALAVTKVVPLPLLPRY